LVAVQSSVLIACKASESKSSQRCKPNFLPFRIRIVFHAVLYLSHYEFPVGGRE